MTKKIKKLLTGSIIAFFALVFIILPRVAQAAPEVISTNPGNGQTGISLDSNINFILSELMDHTTLNGSTVLVSGDVSGAISAASINSYNIGVHTTCVFDPVSNFIAGEVITATVTTGAQNLAGEGLLSNYTIRFTAKSDTTSPNPPTGVSASDTPNDSGGSINLSWQASASSDVTRYIIYRSSNSAGPYTAIASIGNVTFYTDTNSIVDGNYYYYKLKAQDGSNNLSGYSNRTEAFAKENISPSKVTNAKAVGSDRKISLSWKNPSDSDLDGVRILRKTSGYPTNTNDGTVIYTKKGTSHEDTGLSNNTTYYYTLYAYDTSDNYASGVRISAVPKAEAEEEEKSKEEESKEKEAPPTEEKAPAEETPEGETPAPTPAPTPSAGSTPSTPSSRLAGKVAAAISKESVEEEPEEEESTEEESEEESEEEEVVDEASTEEEGRLLDKARATLINFFKPTSLPITVIIILSAAGIVLYLFYGKKKLIKK